MFDIFKTSNLPDKSIPEVMQPYQSFEEIPENLRSDEHLMAWLRSGYGKLGLIPLARVTDDMRALSIRNTGSLRPICFSDTPNYQALALSTLEQWPGLILQVDPEALTEEFVFKAVSVEQTGPQVLNTMLEHWNDSFLDVVSQPVLDSALSRSLAIAAKARTTFELPQSIRDMLTDDQVRLALVDRTYELSYLQEMGKCHILSQAMIAGYWPGHEDSIFFNNAPPQFQTRKPSLFEAIHERTRDKNGYSNGLEFKSTPLRIFFEAYILTFPIEEVLAHCKTQAHARMAGEIYTQAELKPHLRYYPLIKGLLLEDSLGL